MATVVTKYNHTHRRFIRSWDWGTDTFSFRLLTSAYTFSAAHTVWTSASAAELVGAGYTAGGQVLVCSSTNNLVLAEDLYWTNMTATFRQGVIVREGTSDGLTNALVAHFLFNNFSGGTDVVLTDNDFLIRLSSGLFTL
jgi:hypothetical protein